jgi:hypothetical protein
VEAGLSLDIAQGADWDITLWMRDRHTSGQDRVFELNMASLSGNLAPARRL